MLVPAFAVILLFQLIGEVISRATHMPMPGPVLGMVMMVVALSMFPKLGDLVTPVAQGLLRYLAMLFVPVGVGIVSQTGVLEAHWLAISVSVFVSTLVALAVGAWTFSLVARLTGDKTDE